MKEVLRGRSPTGRKSQVKSKFEVGEDEDEPVFAQLGKKVEGSPTGKESNRKKVKASPSSLINYFFDQISYFRFTIKGTIRVYD